MLIDDQKIRQALEGIVVRLSSVPALQDDLRQEALVHLWLLEERRPGQTKSWYLQSCRFHLLNYFAQGRSVDSQKRNAGRVAVGLDQEEYDAFLAEYQAADEFFEKLNARDVMSLLAKRLTAFEREILHHLAEGLGAREIAKRLKRTHPTILKYRKRIAVQAVNLGIPPLLQYRRRPIRRRLGKGNAPATLPASTTRQLADVAATN